ncbi:MAG: M28 family peptidase [Acidobacteria bacterium]|nr:M28 family peptidase [Acidobacteriota bacterium]
MEEGADAAQRRRSAKSSRRASAKKSGKSARGRAKRSGGRRSRVRGRRGRRGRSRGGAAPIVRRKGFDEMIGSNPGALDGTDEEIAGAQIEEFKLRAYVKYLSDDLLEGRGTGTRGGLLAAKFIAAEFESMGLEPAAPDRTFFQQVPMIGVKTDPDTKLTVKSANGEAEFKFADDFVASTDLEQAEIPVNHEIVFVGYGVSAPEVPWNDYKNLDVKDKLVMMLVNDPPATAAEPNLFGGKALTYYGRWTYKFEEAARRGAAGVILVHTTESAGYGWQVVRTGWDGERFGLVPDEKTPTLKFKSWVTEETARKIAQLGGQDLDKLREAAKTRDFKPVALTAKVETTLKTKAQRVTAPNVVAILRGDTPAPPTPATGKSTGKNASKTAETAPPPDIKPLLRDEFVVYSAHWDHLGIRPDQVGDNIYNGAVDNATGIAGLLAIAKAYSNLEVKPKRSILFIATTAEEQGLLGAEFYTRNPLVPLNKTVADINVDSMNVLGMTSDITPLGADRSTLGKIIEEVCKENSITIAPDPRPEQGSFYRSDHFPFAKVGVPAVNFEPGDKFVGHPAEWGQEQFAEYNKNRYHQPTDEYSPNWDFSGMVQQARLAFWIGLRVADADEMPVWKKGDEFERARLKSLGQPMQE